MRKLLWLPITLGLLLVAGNASYACPKKSKCPCGVTCKYVKKCKVYKSCKWKTVCGKKYFGDCKKSLVCHIPPGNPANAHNICVSKYAVKAHLVHGDYLGKCHVGCKKRKVCKYKKCCKYVKKCWCKPCPQKDSGPCPQEDAGPCPQEDAGPCPQEDAGPTPQEDAGPTPQEDAGPIPQEDAGPTPDSEVVEVDGGCPGCPDGTIDETETEDDLEIIGGGCSVASASGGSMLGFGLIIAALLAFRRIRKYSPLLVVGALLLSTTNSRADDYIVTKGAETSGHLKPSIGLSFDYKLRPAQIVKKSNGDRVDDVIHHTAGLTFSGSLGLWSWLQIDLAVPIELAQEANGVWLGKSDENLTGGLGDILLTPRVSLVDREHFNIGLSVPVGMPTTTYDSLVGADAVYVTPTISLEIESKYFNTALNVGYTIVEDQSIRFRSQKVVFDDALTFSLGARIPLWRDHIDILGDGYVSLPAKQISVFDPDYNKEDVPAELLGGFRFYLPYGVQADVAAGGGVGKGVGAPEFRFIAGLSWSPPPPKVVRVTKIVVPECPECPKPRVVKKLTPIPVIKNQVVVIPPVYFDTDKHNLRPDAIKTLDNTVKLLKAHPWIKKVRLEGHCDHRASHKYNEGLSLRRVSVVRDYLVKSGISLKRLEARHYGETQRVDVTKTKKGMQKNRRVEFHVLGIR